MKLVVYATTVEKKQAFENILEFAEGDHEPSTYDAWWACEFSYDFQEEQPKMVTNCVNLLTNQWSYTDIRNYINRPTVVIIRTVLENGRQGWRQIL